MTQTQSAPTMPFHAIITQAINEAFPPSLLRLVPDGVLEAYTFHTLGTPLVYLLNERRVRETLAGETPEEQYEKFSEDVVSVLSELRERFPNHWQHWHQMRNCLSDTVKAVTHAAAEDVTAISELLGGNAHPDSLTILSVKPLGDIHPQGVVCEVTTSLGTIYYKPRSAGNELFLSTLGAWMSERASDSQWLDLWFPRVADCGNHAWVAPVRHEALTSSAAATHYYRRAGQLLGLSYLVNLTDLHHENIIATATQPVPVDLETIMSVLPNTLGEHPDATSATLKQGLLSPAATGLIPLGTSFQELGGDVSGFAADELRVRRRVLDRQGRSDMRYVHTFTKVIPEKNRPTLDGVPVPPSDHVDDIVEGFATTLRIAMTHRNELTAFVSEHASGLRVRVLARMTNDYATVLAGLSRVGHNTDPERLFAMLRRNAVGLAESMVDSEEEQLRVWAIPHFWAVASETTIRDPWGKPTGELTVAPVTQTITKIDAVTEAEIDYQVSLIRLAFRRPEEVILPLGPHLAPQGLGSFDEFERTHLDALHAQTVTGADGSVNWPALTVDEKDQLTVQPLIGGVYRGVAGVAALLASFSQPDARWYRLAQSLLRTLQLETEPMVEDTEPSLSYYHGPAGRLAAAHRLSQAFEISAPWLRHHYDRFLTTVGNITPGDIKPGALLDVMEGPAGLIIALRHHHDTRIRELCHRLSLLLTAAASEGWGSKKVCALSRNASFAHDAGGMGTAVLIAAGMGADPDMVDSWRAAWEFENTFKLEKGWNDARYPGDSHATHWCHGLAGIALARTVWLQSIEDSAFLRSVIAPDEIARIRTELEEAADLLVRDLDTSGSPSLCHGVAGGALVLDLAGRQLRRRDWCEAADDLVARAGATLSRCPWMWGKHDIQDFGIMTGPGGLILARNLLQLPDGGIGPLLPDLRHIGGAA